MPAIPQAPLKCHLLQEAPLVSPTELVLTGPSVILDCRGWFMFLSSSAPGAPGYISSSLEPWDSAGLALPIFCRAATQSEPLTHTRSHPSLPGPFSCSPCTRSPRSQPCSLCSAEGPAGFADPSPSRLLPTPASIPFREGSKMPAPQGRRACRSAAGTPFPAPLRLDLEVASLARPSPPLILNDEPPCDALSQIPVLPLQSSWNPLSFRICLHAYMFNDCPPAGPVSAQGKRSTDVLKGARREGHGHTRGPACHTRSHSGRMADVQQDHERTPARTRTCLGARGSQKGPF